VVTTRRSATDISGRSITGEPIESATATFRRAGRRARPAVPTSKDLRRAGFPFRSGRLCLDFVATMAKRGMGDREMLATPEDLAMWLTCAELPAAAEPISATDLVETRALREAIHALTRARVDQLRPKRSSVQLINTMAQAGPPTATLGLDATTLVSAPTAPIAGILALLARDSIDLFAGPYGNRIRACTAPDCSLFFVDRSRPGSRRWCAMAACGEKASSATYRKRHSGPGSRHF
jgi:predicted RNA-binding Zn ribbon-like protein